MPSTSFTPVPLPPELNNRPFPKKILPELTGQPSKWASQSLFTTTFRDGSSKSMYANDQLSPLTPENRFYTDRTLPNEPKFMKAGGSWDAVLEAAVDRCRSQEIENRTNCAQAVVQAKDGTYYLTNVGSERGTYLVIDPSPYSTSTVTSAVPSVSNMVALVGSTVWVDCREGYRSAGAVPIPHPA